jgi:hypothetical protein
LENGANTTAPGAPLNWDNFGGTATVRCHESVQRNCIQDHWRCAASSTAPTSNVAGDLWYDTVNQQLNVYTGTAFIVVGPAFTPGTGTTGAIVATIVDNTATSHFVIELYANNSIVGIVSKDQTFTPGSAVDWRMGSTGSESWTYYGHWHCQQCCLGQLNKFIGLELVH